MAFWKFDYAGPLGGGAFFAVFKGACSEIGYMDCGLFIVLLGVWMLEHVSIEI